MEKLLVKKGSPTKIRPSKNLSVILKRGLRQARTLSQLGIGQSIAMKAGAVVVVEAMEGTNEAILRAGKWGGKGIILIKTASPHQDWRFDIPTIGLGTIQCLARVKAQGMVVEAGKSFMLDQEKTVRLADSNKMFIHVV